MSNFDCSQKKSVKTCVASINLGEAPNYDRSVPSVEFSSDFSPRSLSLSFPRLCAHHSTLVQLISYGGGICKILLAFTECWPIKHFDLKSCIYHYSLRNWFPIFQLLLESSLWLWGTLKIWFWSADKNCSLKCMLNILQCSWSESKAL